MGDITMPAFFQERLRSRKKSETKGQCAANPPCKAAPPFICTKYRGKRLKRDSGLLAKRSGFAQEMWYRAEDREGGEPEKTLLALLLSSVLCHTISVAFLTTYSPKALVALRRLHAHDLLLHV